MKKKQLTNVKAEYQKLIDLAKHLAKNLVEIAETFYLSSPEAQKLARENIPLPWNLLYKIGSGRVNPDLYGLEGNFINRLIEAPRSMQDEALSGPVEVVVKNGAGEWDIRMLPFNEMTYSQKSQVFDFVNGTIRTPAQQRSWLDNQKKKEERRFQTLKKEKSIAEICVVHKKSKVVEITERTILSYSQLCRLIGELGD